MRIEIELNDEMAAELELVRRESNCSSVTQLLKNAWKWCWQKDGCARASGGTWRTPYGTPVKKRSRRVTRSIWSKVMRLCSGAGCAVPFQRMRSFATMQSRARRTVRYGQAAYDRLYR